jgi:hypothetical protein
MIAQVGIFIFLCVLSYIAYVCLPEIKKSLLKVKVINNINNITIPQTDSVKSIENEKECFKEEVVEKELNIEKKLDDIFIDPVFKEIKTNFKDLGEVK